VETGLMKNNIISGSGIDEKIRDLVEARLMLKLYGTRHLHVGERKLWCRICSN